MIRSSILCIICPKILKRRATVISLPFLVKKPIYYLQNIICRRSYKIWIQCKLKSKGHSKSCTVANSFANVYLFIYLWNFANVYGYNQYTRLTFAIICCRHGNYFHINLSIIFSTIYNWLYTLINTHSVPLYLSCLKSQTF